MLYKLMPFVPRSQIEQQKANAPPPPMPVVENYPKHPTACACPQQPSDVEEQINELNELLVYVLDEISSMKEALYENARKKKKKHKQQHKKHVQSEDEDTSNDEEEAPAATAAAPPPKKMPLPPAISKALDFSSCF